MPKINIKAIVLLFVILFIAGFLRLYNLHSVPPGLYPDEAMNANDALANPGKIFYPENNGREGLFVNLTVISFKIFGPSPFSLRLVSAIVGILTVLGLYLLTNELFRNETYSINSIKFRIWLSLLASFFLAISFWHINFSRIGFRGILLPFVLVFFSYFLFLGLRKKNGFNIIVAGIFFGLGAYTYSSFRMTVLMLPFVFIPCFLEFRKQKQQKKIILYALYFILAAVIVAIPLGLYFPAHPGDFFGRLGAVSIFSQHSFIKAFFISLGKHLAMFNISGDYNWRHNLPGAPQLLWPIGILFLLGFLTSVKNFFSSFRAKDYQELAIYSFLLAWFFAMLLPGALTYEGIPHALRTIGVIPVVYIFAALGGFWLFETIKKSKLINFEPKIKLLKYFLTFYLVFLAFTLFYAQAQKYFSQWAQNPNVLGAFTQNFVDIGNVLNSLPNENPKYVIVNEGGTPVPYPDGIPVPAQTIMFMERIKYGGLKAIYLKPDELNKIKTADQSIAIIPMRFDDEISNKLKEQFPSGAIQEINGIKIYRTTLFEGGQ